MYNERQTEILTQITQGLDLPADMASEVRVVQTPGCIDSVVETHDFATALMGAIGQAVAAVGERRGLDAQRVTVDRPHAGEWVLPDPRRPPDLLQRCLPTPARRNFAIPGLPERPRCDRPAGGNPRCPDAGGRTFQPGAVRRGLAQPGGMARPRPGPGARRRAADRTRPARWRRAGPSEVGFVAASGGAPRPRLYACRRWADNQ